MPSLTASDRLTDLWLADDLAREHYINWKAIRARSDPVKCPCGMVHPTRDAVEDGRCAACREEKDEAQIC